MFSTIVFIALVGFTIWRLIAEYRAERAAHASKAPPLPGTPAVFRVDPCTELPAARPAADRSPEGDTSPSCSTAGSTSGSTSGR